MKKLSLLGVLILVDSLVFLKDSDENYQQLVVCYKKLPRIFNKQEVMYAYV